MQREIGSKGSVVAPEDVRRGVIDLIGRVGERKAIEVLLVGRLTIYRVVAGLPVRRATAEMVSIRLKSPAAAAGLE